MKAQSAIGLIIVIGSLEVTKGHEYTEDDYWANEEFWQDKSYKVQTTVKNQIQEMIPPGALCDANRQYEAHILHHAVRHGLTLMTKRQFTNTVLHNMCVMMPEFGVNSYFQLFRCQSRRCDCPFHFMTWSQREKKCKIMETKKCGDFKVLDTTVNLNQLFGCEDNTTCVEEPERNLFLDFESQKNAICKCKAGLTCGSLRQVPPPINVLPWTSASTVNWVAIANCDFWIIYALLFVGTWFASEHTSYI